MAHWILIVRVSGKEPVDYDLKAGDNSIGRYYGSDIVIDEISASRQHAVINYDQNSDTISIYDLDSTNGTYVNRERLTRKQRIYDKDVVRIGSSVLTFVRPGAGSATRELTGTHPLTRERVLEALDHNAVLMYEVSERLNAVTDLNDALAEVSELMKKAMRADRCKVILAPEFGSFQELGFPKTMAETAIETGSAVVMPDTGELQPSESAVFMRLTAALCIPVIAGEEVIALIYMYKTDPTARLFTQNDLQVGVAISHQSALTIQRMQLMEQVQKEQNARLVLQRFVSPQETEYLLKDFAAQDRLPDPEEKYVSVMFVDIADSTSLAENLGARDFGLLLNQFYLILTEIVFQRNGVVRYLGDGIMAIFGMMRERSDFEEDAVNVGLSIKSKVTTENFGVDAGIQIGIGITTGKVVVGYVGTEERVELTVLGDSVNVAHRLQSHARPNPLLIDENTKKALPNQYQTGKLTPITVKGRQSSVNVFEVFAKNTSKG